MNLHLPQRVSQGRRIHRLALTSTLTFIAMETYHVLEQVTGNRMIHVHLRLSGYREAAMAVSRLKTLLQL